MAKLIPEIEVIKRQKVQPTNGEWVLLNFLLANLDDSYEIYFQPFLNGDNPDFAIMRKGSGVLLIEVKDWHLDSYYIDEFTNWRVAKNDAIIKSPFEQVLSYKDNLYNLHIEDLCYRNIENRYNWSIVNCAVYFHCETYQRVENFLFSQFAENKYESYRKQILYFGILGKNSLNSESLTVLLDKFRLNRSSRLFDDILYHSFFRYLKSPIHLVEEGIPINYTKAQKELIRSEIRPRRKIRGVAGSGKTLVLARRAVNAHIRTNSRVLILTFNLTLKNYIHDRISDVREEFNWNSFYIINYHQFIRNAANHHNLKIFDLRAWNNLDFFEPVKDTIQKYDAVFIDEIQDYEQAWLDIIATYFIHDETEWVVFGDEKQDIYQKNLVVRNIPGVWNKSLDNSFRFTGAIANLAINFQKKIFGHKYELDDVITMSLIDYEKRILEYHFFNSYTPSELFHEIYTVLERNSIHSSDAGILCSKVEILRAIDFEIRTRKKERTNTIFETQEQYELIFKARQKDLTAKGLPEKEAQAQLQAQLNKELKTIRKLKKNHFWMKSGTIKLSTVHSFKGWEIDTLFLFIENENGDHEFTNAELIYTGLTRARRNLIVFNLGNLKFDSFFKEEIPIQFIKSTLPDS